MNSKKLHLTSIVLSLLVSSQAFSKTDPVDQYIQCEMQANKIPGLSIAVIENGKVIKAKGYGLTNVELNVPAKPESIYQSGSIGKQFTATLIMILVEKGLINLDDKISVYIKDAPKRWQDISIRNLLTHTSGLTRNLPDIDLRLNYTDDELINRIRPYPLDFQPGTAWRYSNSGYVLLGIIIKKVTGEFYGDLLKEYIFTPLDMKTTRMISDRDIVMNRSAGYDLIGDQLKNQEYASPTLDSTADGALYFNVLDLVKWDAALYTEKLLKKSDLELMWTPVKLNDGKTEKYGFGWRLDNINGHRLVEHGGEWQGFTGFISRYVDDKLTVIILTNLSGQSELGPMAHHIASVYNPKLSSKETSDIAYQDCKNLAMKSENN